MTQVTMTRVTLASLTAFVVDVLKALRLPADDAGIFGL